MSSQSLYLLTHTAETQQQLAKIEALLFSNETPNQILALKLLAGGGVPNHFWSYMVGVLYDEQNPDLMKAVTELMYTYDQEELADALADFDFQNSIHTEWSKRFNIALDFLEAVNHELFIDFPFLEPKQIAKAMLICHKEGLRYCFEHEVLPIKTMLEIFMSEGTRLDLSYQGLLFLPDEIGEFPYLTHLNISHNFIQELPESLQRLTKLETLYHTDTPLSAEAIRFLEHHFPKIVAERYHDEVVSRFRRANYDQETQRLIDRVLALAPDNPTYWITKGAVYGNSGNPQLGLEATLKATQIAPTPDNIDTILAAWSNVSGFYRRLGQDHASLDAAQQGFDLLAQYPQHTQWEDDLYFRKAQALYHLERLEDSLQVYTEGLKKYPDSSGMLYNTACIYARWHDKQKMLHYLQSAIAEKGDHRAEATKDPDFREYWQDSEFLSLVGTAISGD
jgi:tetratricopeptide (TPR) repeat protein